ncbi:putative quinol monooxygenase [Hoeflea prorocentri]|uniref:Quinol monooxygenase n=1 Tax=Hoeflea prorocentri TaxID=1922333 RepID=A0A9X3ZHT0_9HYPH|nr:putative quinol monooxygenase [Hoeflea prorocentri]MCY6381151.1 putative quinol monooxygenase [Hoeflea prorocentri]MDA5398951.1 putative quinol monooxygenase [Hoeflea prorocentri]
MFAVVVTFQIKTEHWDSFLEIMRDNARASKELEPACRHFDVCTDDSRPYEVFLYELYDDEAAFETHQRMAHFKEFSAAAADMIADKSVITFGSVT